MARVSGDRFSSQNMFDCEFCLPEGRRFRTQRQCTQCGKPLCLVCRPSVPNAACLCPECGGGPLESALKQPEVSIQRIRKAGYPVPFWLSVIQERVTIRTAEVVIEEEIVPE